jgi:hypothetical protein
VTLTAAQIQNTARAGRIKWRYHAFLRAQQRGITREQTLRVLQEGEIIEQESGAKPYQSV